MALVHNPGGFPTLSEVARVLSDERVGLGTVTRADVLDAARERGVTIFQGRVDSKRLADIYFEICAVKDATERKG